MEKMQWSQVGTTSIVHQRVCVIGDSFIRGLEKIFNNSLVKTQWRVDSNNGCEALTIPLEEAMPREYDHIIFCSAGNGLWKKVWGDAAKNISQLDPKKTSVVFIGSNEFWTQMAGEKPVHATFFEDAQHALHQRQVRCAHLSQSFVESIEYVDTEGHPTKGARFEVAQKLLEAFEDLVACKANASAAETT